MFDTIRSSRRRCVGATAMTVATAQLGVLRSVRAHIAATKSAHATAVTAASNTSSGSVKQVDASLLNVGLR